MAVIEIVASGGPVGPGQVAAGNITVTPGDTYVVTDAADANISFESGDGSSVSFEVVFDVDYDPVPLENFTVGFDDNTNPTITIADDLDLSEIEIDASDAESVDLTIGDGVALEEYVGSDGVDTISIGADFSTTKDFKTGKGDDVVEIGNNADFDDENLDFGEGDNQVTIGFGLTAKDIKAKDGDNEINIGLDLTTDPPDPRTTINNIDVGDGNNTINVGPGLTANDIKTGNGNNTLTFGDGLIADKIRTGDGDDVIEIGDDATIKELKSDKGDDSIVIGDNFTAEKLEAGDGDDNVKIGDDGVVSKKLDGGKGDDTLASSTDFPDADNFETVVCFGAGTLIETDHGVTPVEDLCPGDLVRTMDHGYKPVRWSGSTTVIGKGSLAPIIITKGALGNHRDILVSPQHRVLVAGWQIELISALPDALVAAKHLVNGTTIRQRETPEITYVHLLFDTHEIIYSEGIPTESFHPGEVGISNLSDDVREEIYILFPELRGDLSSYGPSARKGLTKTEARVLVNEGLYLQAG